MLQFLSSRLTTEHITLEEVYDAYYSCRRKKRRKRSALEYELNYEVENYRLWEELNLMTYKPGTSIAFCVSKPKLREIFAASFRDRIVHHLIVNKFNQLFESIMISDSYACRKNKGTMYGIKRVSSMMKDVTNDFKSEAWIVKCDINSFFTSIDVNLLHKFVIDIIKKHIHNDTNWWIWLVSLVILHRPQSNCIKCGDLRLWDDLPAKKSLFHNWNTGLAIGNLTSQIFANIYMTVFDKWVSSQYDGKLMYGRYVDDFVIMHKDKKLLLNLLNRIRIKLNDNLGLTLHSNKIYIQKVKRGVNFTGCFLKYDCIYSGKRMKYNSSKVVKRWNNKDKHTEEERKLFMIRMNSYFGLLKHYFSYRFKQKLWNNVKDKCNIICVKNNKINIQQ